MTDPSLHVCYHFTGRDKNNNWVSGFGDCCLVNYRLVQSSADVAALKERLVGDLKAINRMRLVTVVLVSWQQLGAR